MQFSVYGGVEIYRSAVAMETGLGRDQLVTSRRRILLPRRHNFAGESIKNFHLLSTKLYILGNVIFLSVSKKKFVTLSCLNHRRNTVIL